MKMTFNLADKLFKIFNWSGIACFLTSILIDRVNITIFTYIGFVFLCLATIFLILKWGVYGKNETGNNS